MAPRKVLADMIRGGGGSILALVALTCCSNRVALTCCSKSGSEYVATAHAAASAEPKDDGSLERVRLISQEQYFATITDMFGTDMRIPAQFPPLIRTDGLLASGAESAGVTATGLEQYQQAAAVLAARIVDPAHRDFLIPCRPASPSAADAACARRFLKTTGRLLYRGRLDDAELARLVERAGKAADQLKDFYAGLSIALEGMLISPHFLFIVDTSQPDPGHLGRRRLDGYSIASRLSFFLWNSAPDDALLKSAEKGELYTPLGRARAVDRLLASPRTEAGVRAFFDDMLAFDDFDNLAKDPAIYPAFTGATALDAREQTLRTIVDLLLVKKADYRDLYTTRSTFISPALAALYRVPSAPTWEPYEFPADSPRVGLLTQISFLAVHAHPGRSSATLRGKALRETLLCQKVPRPPSNVDFSIVEDPNAHFHTARERLTAHRSNPVCAGCHKIMDPIGLGLENFDGAGAFRVAERGMVIDPSGTLDGHTFSDPIGLSKALHDHPALPTCLVKRIYAYGVGGSLSPNDGPALAYFNARFREQGYRLPDLLRTIALSNAFSEVAEKHNSPPGLKTAAVSSSAAAIGVKEISP